MVPRFRRASTQSSDSFQRLSPTKGLVALREFARRSVRIGFTAVADLKWMGDEVEESLRARRGHHAPSPRCRDWVRKTFLYCLVCNPVGAHGYLMCALWGRHITAGSRQGTTAAVELHSLTQDAFLARTLLCHWVAVPPSSPGRTWSTQYSLQPFI
jgi:hypothetical protein